MLVFLLLFGLTNCLSPWEENLVNYYENLIEDNKERSAKYHAPSDAGMYKPNDPNAEPEDFGVYDFIVVGAGATGTVVANRLSEIPEWNILLIEAGSLGTDFNDIPSLNFDVANSDYSWHFRSIPQTTSCLGLVNKTCPHLRGKGVGGSTLINGLAYVRGHPLDFDRWAAMGNPGWSYEEVLPYFIKSENFSRTSPNAVVEDELHGKDGYLSVEYHLPENQYLEAFLKANEELGYQLTDHNGPQQVGASQMQINVKHGRRADGGSAFIKPILHRENLKLMTNSLVTKIIINENSKTAEGVLFSYNNRIYRATAAVEVIICAGSYSSPQLLMLSGIGPTDHLNEIGIPVIQNLEVGSSLRDHSQYYGLTFSSNISIPSRPMSEYIREYLKGVGPLAIPGPNVGVGFYQSSFQNILTYPDYEFIMISPNSTLDSYQRVIQWDEETFDATWGGQDVTNSFSIYIVNLHQQSVGTLRLRSNSPYDFPLIDPNFFTDPENRDITVLYEAVQFALELTSTEAFQKIGARLQAKPLPACSLVEPFSEDYWYCSLRHLSYNVYHPISTCQMGPDPSEGAVVDNELKVYGIRKLRVADASIFPLTFAGHPNAPCVMVGEKVSDLIKFEYGKL